MFDDGKEFRITPRCGDLSQASIRVSTTELHTSAPLRVRLPGLVRNNAFLQRLWLLRRRDKCGTEDNE